MFMPRLYVAAISKSATLSFKIPNLPCGDPADLPQSTAGARSALDYRSMVGRGQAIYIGDLENGTVVRLSFGEGRP